MENEDSEKKQKAILNSIGQIALVGSSIDPEYEKAKEARRRKRREQAALASTQAEGLEQFGQRE